MAKDSTATAGTEICPLAASQMPPVPPASRPVAREQQLCGAELQDGHAVSRPVQTLLQRGGCRIKAFHLADQFSQDGAEDPLKRTERSHVRGLQEAGTPA